MAEATAKKSQGQGSGKEQGEEQSVATRGEQGTAQRSGVPSFFSLSPRELLSASPFELMRRFAEDMDRFFEGFGPRWSLTPAEPSVWAPPIEVTEQDGKYKICAELPGLRKEDVKVELTPDGLAISGERKREHEERREGLYRSERSYGRFYRLIPIPEEADIDHAKAHFENGVLTVTVPIPESKRRRREIPIETGGQQEQASSRAA